MASSRNGIPWIQPRTLLRLLVALAAALWMWQRVPLPLWVHAATAAEAGPARELPPEIADAFRNLQIDEEGYLMPDRTTIQKLIDYVKEGHWRWMAAHPEVLPLSTNPRFKTQGRRYDETCMILSAACAELPPADRAGFLEIFTEMYENRRISFGPMQRALCGNEFNRRFTETNCGDRHIRQVVDRVLAAMPNETLTDRDRIEDLKKGNDGYWLAGSNMSEAEVADSRMLMPWSLPTFPYKHFLLQRLLPAGVAAWAMIKLIPRLSRGLGDGRLAGDVVQPLSGAAAFIGRAGARHPHRQE